MVLKRIHKNPIKTEKYRLVQSKIRSVRCFKCGRDGHNSKTCLLNNISGIDRSIFEVTEIFEVESMSFETPPIFDEYPDDEDNVNNLMGGPETGIESFGNSLNFDEDHIGDLLVSSTVMSTNLEVNSFSTAHDLVVLKKEVSRYGYEDHFLKPRSETTNERYFKFFRRCNTQFDFSFEEIMELIIRLSDCGLHNSILIYCVLRINGSELLTLYQHILSFPRPIMKIMIAR
jgi:hypothetical protein